MTEHTQHVHVPKYIAPNNFWLNKKYSHIYKKSPWRSLAISGPFATKLHIIIIIIIIT